LNNEHFVATNIFSQVHLESLYINIIFALPNPVARQPACRQTGSVGYPPVPKSTFGWERRIHNPEVAIVCGFMAR